MNKDVKNSLFARDWY